MEPSALESRNVSLVGYHDLGGRPGFKLALQAVDDRWYLYTAHLWHSGWSVVDVTDPTDPEHCRFVEGPANTATVQVQVADGTMITSLEQPIPGFRAVDGPDYDPTTPHTAGAYVWDVETDPTDPRRVGHYDTGGGGTHRNHYDGGDYAYMAADLPGYTGKSLTVVDVSDPSAPEEVARWAVPGQAPGDDARADGTYYFHGPAYPDGDVAYLSYGREGVVVLDLSDPTDPRQVTRFDFGILGSWLGVHSAVPLPGRDVLVVNDEAILEERADPMNYTFLVDVSDLREPGFDGQSPAGPTVVGALPTPVPEASLPYDAYHDKGGRFGPHNQHHYQYQDEHLRSEDLLFMTWFNAGLRIFDVGDARNPREVGYYVPDDPAERIGTKPETALVTQFEDVLVDARGYVYCTAKNRGLFVFETDLV